MQRELELESDNPGLECQPHNTSQVYSIHTDKNKEDIYARGDLLEDNAKARREIMKTLNEAVVVG